MNPSRFVGSSFSLLCLLLSPAAAQLPYNPTRILQNDTLLYVFRPSSNNQFEFNTLDVTSTLQSSNLPYNTLYQTLPFLESDSLRAFTPVLDDGGTITVYTGDCASGAGGAELWTFTPDNSLAHGNGSWKQEQVLSQDLGDSGAVAGPNFLNGGTSFSSLVKGDASTTGAYFFGGMCPFQNATEDTWMSSANYSNLMLTIEPSPSTTKQIDYQIGISSSRGPPIAEAGFTMTGLEPTYSNKSDGTQTQQQDFVLLGGHTSAAFINMSQVALFSLPQESWSFFPVAQPNLQRTDLSVRTDVTEIEPRSGHTAVLTSDGQSIVVFGGWVGDTNTPADPQFCILNVGERYGGLGSWTWTVPTTSGTGLANGAGIYGHGAVMLPGGVMMIVGGYTIPLPSSPRLRRASQSANSQTLFFNVTSNTWLSEYSPPASTSKAPAMAETGPLSTTSQKAGLGVGLAIGGAAVLGLLIFYFWYVRRLKKRRDLRERELRELALGAHRYHEGSSTAGNNNRGGNMEAAEYFDDPQDMMSDPCPYPTGAAQGWRRAQGRDVERTGLLVEIPSPTRGLRRSLSGRGSHHLPRYDDKRVRGSGNIHPIDELDEDEHNRSSTDGTSGSVPEMTESNTKRISAFSNVPTLDPFLDPNPPTSHPVEPRHSRDLLSFSAPSSPIRERPSHPQAWEHEWNTVTGAILPQISSPSNSGGRVSPSKSDRTESNLSERSTRSNLSSNSNGGSSLGRSISIRSAVLLNSIANPFMALETSPTIERLPNRLSGGWQTSTESRTRFLTNPRPNNANGDADSFATARSSFAQLQAEGEALLGGPPSGPPSNRPDTSSSTTASNIYHDAPATSATAIGPLTAPPLTDSRPPPERRMSWLGTVRRAIVRTATLSNRSRSMTASTPKYDWSASASSSPTKSMPDHCTSFPASSAPPRRAASDASLWRSKRGARDWAVDDEGEGRWRRNRGDDWGAPEDMDRGDGDGEEDEDWDVEAAVERRVVQVMFTVPKQRLRVVNAECEADGVSLISLDDRERRGGEGIDKERMGEGGAGVGR
ncbi:hypothetical protein K432DRAFT_386311 [Lepidopterella palustris CBS 459.81]|uniref:Galactose oxidase n=1 Tax=Lepidopterella palustris CBS 459.81 TaxID=1314670 RepID=A0A8E2E0W3_9PEZI|nr:hypothetical protein K432DRAFT_386311 [Lepidopterella palustris CBS 459.81]